MIYEDQKVSKEELDEIFKSNIDRNIFISDYLHFGEDGNDTYYQEFIDSFMGSSGRARQEDAIELSMAVHLYKSSYLGTIKKISYAKRTDSIKLLCLDWLFNFFENIPKKEFQEINTHVLTSCDNELVKIQCLINLLLVSANEQLNRQFVISLNGAQTPAFFYRIITGLKNRLLKEVFRNVKNDISKAITANNVLTSKQKDELLRYLE